MTRVHHFLSAALLAGLCCACQSTSFQTPPLAAGACDTALAGRWLSLDAKGEPDGEMELQVSGDCELEVADRNNGVIRRGRPTRLHTARDGGQSFLWVDAAWATTRFEATDLAVDPHDVYVLRYEVDDAQLLVNAMDDKAVAHLIIDGKVPGTIRSGDNELVNRITGPARPEILQLPGVFSADPLRFRREGSVATP